ncbi:hypothetical protein GCM10009733_063770 [Nonomuraea maheshkhaliensis]|uniref:DUF4261 domain-containing protein n=1 Tax=Nonomuraea maheshkhaliensis TaxID=419590 RepID=A0ABP4RPR8_9ACTN
MGAKTSLIAYSDGDLPGLLRTLHRPDASATAALIDRAFPGWAVSPAEPGNLSDDVRPPEDLAYATSFPGVELICSDSFMLDNPSLLPSHLVEASRGRRLVLHAMHSVVDWLAFAVWEDGRLVRSLSLSPGHGVIEDIGEPFPFELPFWEGLHPVEPDPAWGDTEPYALPFHPLELGEVALHVLFGFTIEGDVHPEDVDPEDVALLGFNVVDPDGPTPEERRAELMAIRERMGEPRFFRPQGDGTLREIGIDELA